MRRAYLAVSLDHRPHLESVIQTLQTSLKKHAIELFVFVDHYKLESKNLAPMKGDDKLLSINNTIRKAINKDGGDFVTVTLFLLNNKEHINKTQILNSFNDAGVLEKFERLPDDVQNEILRNILDQKTVENQINKIVFYIKKLSK